MARLSLKHKFLPFIPLYYYPHFIVMDANNVQPLRAGLENAGIALTEEDYLLGNYPKELAAQSRDYILKEKNHVKEKIKSEALCGGTTGFEPRPGRFSRLTLSSSGPHDPHRTDRYASGRRLLVFALSIETRLGRTSPLPLCSLPYSCDHPWLA